MWNSAFIAIRMYVVTLLVLGVAMPFAITGAAQLTMGWRADGSLLRDSQGEVVGSELIGQAFSTGRYFHSRPSAAGNGYDAMASGGTNLGPTSGRLAEALAVRAREVTAYDGGDSGKVPVDMITASASGLDPDISPANALTQVARIAASRGLDAEDVRLLVLEGIRGRDLGFIGEPRVNVLELNRALDQLDAER